MRAGDDRVVDHHVEPPAPLDGGVGRAGRCRPSARRRPGGRLAAPALARRSARPSAGRPRAGPRGRRRSRRAAPSRGERERHRAAQARRSAGDDDRLAGEPRGSAQQPLREAAVDQHGDAVDVGGAVSSRGTRQRRRSRPGRRTVARGSAPRRRGGAGRVVAAGVEILHPLGVDVAGRDRVDRDAVRALLLRQRLGPADHAGAVGVRQQEARRSAPSRRTT